MTTETISLLVKGGAATAGPPLGPKLGPTGINVGAVVGAINEKTSSMKGMDVPVKVILDLDKKSFEIEVGTPPTAALIKKELGLEKGSGKPGSEMIADIPIDNIIKIAKVKVGSFLSNNLTSAVKEVIGTCQSIGVEIEGMMPRDAIRAINEGMWEDKITGKVALEEHSPEELKARQAELKAEIEAKHKEEEAEKVTEGAEKPSEAEGKPEVKLAEEEKQEENPADKK